LFSSTGVSYSCVNSIGILYWNQDGFMSAQNFFKVSPTTSYYPKVFQNCELHQLLGYLFSQVCLVLIIAAAIIVYRIVITIDYCGNMSPTYCLLATTVVSSLLNAIAILILGKVINTFHNLLLINFFHIIQYIAYFKLVTIYCFIFILKPILKLYWIMLSQLHSFNCTHTIINIETPDKLLLTLKTAELYFVTIKLFVCEVISKTLTEQSKCCLTFICLPYFWLWKSSLSYWIKWCPKAASFLFRTGQSDGFFIQCLPTFRHQNFKMFFFSLFNIFHSMPRVKGLKL